MASQKGSRSVFLCHQFPGVNSLLVSGNGKKPNVCRVDTLRGTTASQTICQVSLLAGLVSTSANVVNGDVAGGKNRDIQLYTIYIYIHRYSIYMHIFMCTFTVTHYNCQYACIRIYVYIYMHVCLHTCLI